MESPREWWRRLRAWRGRGAWEREMEEEMAFHVERQTEANQRAGMAPAEARRAALVAFGAAERFREEARDETRPRLLEDAWQDVRYGARVLRRGPVFTLVATLSLALGIGANTAIFSLVDAVLLRPPAHVAAPDRLLAVYTSDFSGPPYGGSSYPDFSDLRGAVPALAALAAHAQRDLSLATTGETLRVRGELVSGDYFALLGVDAALGRLLLPGEGEVPGRDAVAVLSHSLWEEMFGADPAVVGRTIRVAGAPLEVVGVAPRGFAGPTGRAPADLWVPLGMEPVLLPSMGGASRLEHRGARWLGMTARLRPGANVEEARTQLGAAAAALAERHPEAWSDVSGGARRLTAVPESAARVSPADRAPVVGLLGALAGMVGLVLLLTCANVANLLMARAGTRRREIAIRLATGAGRGRIVRQLLAESALLTALGAAAGVALALGLTRALRALDLPLPVAVSMDLRLDARVLAFALTVSVLTGLLFGLLPALQAARPELVPALREGPAAERGRAASLRGALVVVQVAVSAVLLFCAGLFLRSLDAAVGVDVGFRTEDVALLPLPLEVAGYEPERGAALYREVLARARALPGVEAAALAEVVPLSGHYQRRGVVPQGYQPRPGEDMEVDFNVVTPGYFAALDVALQRGRALAEGDREGAPPVAVVSEAFARRFWPGQEALGRRVDLGAGREVEVVGVARDTRIRALDEAPRPQLYLPLAQQYSGGMVLHVRAARDAAALIPALRAEVRALDPRLPTREATTLAQATGAQLTPLRAAGTLFSSFGALALVVSSIGLYGVLSYLVTRRTREIGLRIALGARPGDVVRGVVRGGLLLAALGAALGLLASLAAARLVAGLLFQTGTRDPVAVAGVALLLALVAVAASYLPARRASRVDPMLALRTE